MNRPIVFDTVVLSNFTTTGTTDVLVRRFDRPATVPTVVTELERGIEEGYEFLADAVSVIDGHEEFTVVAAEPSPGTVVPEIAAAVDAGEAEALATAIQRNGMFASDDGAARRLAEERGVPYTGSIGILADLVRRGTLSVSEADDWLETWIVQNGYYSPIESVGELLDD